MLSSSHTFCVTNCWFISLQHAAKVPWRYTMPPITIHPKTDYQNNGYTASQLLQYNMVDAQGGPLSTNLLNQTHVWLGKSYLDYLNEPSVLWQISCSFLASCSVGKQCKLIKSCRQWHDWLPTQAGPLFALPGIWHYRRFFFSFFFLNDPKNFD